jgi:hypothetical protein
MLVRETTHLQARRVLALALVAIAPGWGIACFAPAEDALADAYQEPAEDVLARDARDDGRAEPALPDVFLSLPDAPASGRVLRVSGTGSLLRTAGEDFQRALSDARPGDVIELEAGHVYTGHFVLPNKSRPADRFAWITIRTSAEAELSPPGTRVGPADAPFMPKIVSPNADPAVATAPGARGYRLVGLEITVADGVEANGTLVAFGLGREKSRARVARDLSVERCYVHGTAAGELKRGIALNSASTSVVDSHVSDCKGDGYDTQAVCGWNGPGPFKIVNNYLEAAGENLMFGGADSASPEMIPSDVEIRGNTFAKPLAWNPHDASFAGRTWTVKNLLELKCARRVLIDGNVFEYCWAGAQVGFAVVIKATNQEGTAPWTMTRDVTFVNNVVRHTASALNLLGSEGGAPTKGTKRVLVRNNLFYDVGGPRWGGGGDFLQISDMPSVTVDHNTVSHLGSVIVAYGPESKRFVFTNNLVQRNEYGVKGDNRGEGNDTIRAYFPKAVLAKNVLVGADAASYPSGNFYPATLDAVNFTNAPQRDFRLAPTSPYRGAGTDGRDVGCDEAVVQTALLTEPEAAPFPWAKLR